MSSASGKLQRAALINGGLRSRVVRVTAVKGFVPIATPAFQGWGDFTEEQATPGLRSHFETHFRLPPGTRVVDVHDSEPFLTYDVSNTDTQGRDVETHLSGKTDLLATTVKHTDDVTALVTGVVCLVELKTAKALRQENASSRAQAVFELLSIEQLSCFAVPVVLTNLREHAEDGSGIYIFYKVGNAIHEYVGKDGEPLTLAEANGILAVLMPVVLAEHAKVDAKTPTVEEDDDNDSDADVKEDEVEENDDEEEGQDARDIKAATAPEGSSKRRSPRLRSCGRGSSNASRGQRRAGGDAALLAVDARQHADLKKELHACHLHSLVDSSPLIKHILRHVPLASTTTNVL